MKKVLSEKKSHVYGIVLMVLERLRDYFYEMRSFGTVCMKSFGMVVYKVMVSGLVCCWVILSTS